MARTLTATALEAGIAGAPHLPRTAGKANAQRQSTLVVENMHCGGCMRKAEAALLAVQGITAARANLSSRRVTVTSPEPPLEAMIEALAKAGFKASSLADTSTAAANGSDADYLRRLGVAGFAAANIMLLSVSVWSGQGGDMTGSTQTMFHWLSALIALPAIAFAGQPFFRSARQALGARRLNMDVPISLGVMLATAMSLFQTIRGSEQVYFDAAITLLFFLLIGRYLDIGMRTRAAGAALNLLGLRAQSATIIHPDGTTGRLPTKAIEPGMRMLIAAGERVPVDGRVLAGRADIDDSLITGESRPRPVAPGDRLYSGTVALSGPLQAEATSREESTLLAEIARLMETAQQARGRYVRLADRAARFYAPAVHVLGLATFMGWIAAGAGWEQALTAAIAVLIITCPCALALAVPAVQVVATGRLLRQGIIVKAPDGLERLAEVDTVVLDKTGTLTLGRPRLLESTAVSAADLSLAASLAASSRHPYSLAIVEAASERGCSVVPASGVEEVAGAGLRLLTEGGVVQLGSARFCNVDATGSHAGTSSLWLRNGAANPIELRFADALRSDAIEATARLSRRGYAVELLSGDRNEAVEAAADAVAIGIWRGEQRPDQKIARLEELKRQGRKVLMIGDGLNDAPALAAGHASLSPASAADISQTVADAIFQGERLAPILETLAVARAARRRALQNFAIAIGYNMVFVPLAMAGWVTPLIAAIAMSASSIAVTGNALRLGFGRLEVTP